MEGIQEGLSPAANVCYLWGYSPGPKEAAEACFQRGGVGRNGRFVRARTQCPWPDTRGLKGTWPQRGQA